jgi:hypothetical protein
MLERYSYSYLPQYQSVTIQVSYTHHYFPIACPKRIFSQILTDTHLPYLASILVFRKCHAWFFRCPLCGAPDERLDPIYSQECSWRLMDTRYLAVETWVTPTNFCGIDEFRGWVDAPRPCDRCGNWEGQAIETMRRELEEQEEFERRFWDGIYRPK